jgi:hypothetical protein
MFCSKRKAAIAVGYGAGGPSVAKMPLQSTSVLLGAHKPAACLD